MPLPPTPSPAESLATLLRCLLRAVIARVIGGRTPPLVTLLMSRFREAIDRFTRLAARIEAGTYQPRRSPPRRQAAAPRPGRPNEIPQKIGWLVAQEPMAAQYRWPLLNLLQEPEMVALIEAAPVETGRILRPLCWALGVKPPPILARPRPPAPGEPPPPPPPKYQRPPPRPPVPPIPPPNNTLGIHPIQFLPLGPPPKPA